MKKVLLVLSLLAMVFSEADTNALFGAWRSGSYNAPADYPACCTPRTVDTGCRRRCCRDWLIGRPRWTCCRTLKCCKPKRVCCPRYKCCKPKPACCPVSVPVCETNSCVTTPKTTCYEDPSNIPADQARYASYGSNSYVSGNTTCTEDYSSVASYPTSYGQPTEHSIYSSAEELV